MEQPRTEITIPILPCQSIDQTIAFYQALGFVVTYQQKRPNTYAVVKLNAIELHFFVLKDQKPEANYSTCLVIVPHIDALYESFTAGLKKEFGKLPVKGYPRINPLKDMPSYGTRQFIVVDPSGNYIRIGQPIQKTADLSFRENNPGQQAGEASDLRKAYELGSRLADAKNDWPAAAKVVDKALEAPENPDPTELLRLYILRLDIAIRREENNLIPDLTEKVETLKSGLNPLEIKEEIRLFEELRGLI